MLRDAIKKIAGRLTETIVTILLVLVFFSVILGLLNLFFPTGTGIKNLIGKGFLSSPWKKESAGDLVLTYGNDTAPGKVEAVLVNVQNTVKKKRARDIAWSGAEAGAQLYDKDAVQTMSGSSARIDFDKENYLQLGENSLIVIKRIDTDPYLREKRSILVMMEGEIRGKIARTGDSAVHMEVTTPSAVARIMSAKSEEGQAEFRISVNKDMSSTITILQGTAEVSGQGQTVTIGKNQSTTVSLAEAPSQPKKPEKVAPLLPADGTIYYYRDLPPKVDFKWTSPSGEKGYHLLIAKDHEMKGVVVDERVQRPSFSHGNLKKGTYYWRIYGTNMGADNSAPHMIQIIQDKEPPSVDMESPPEFYQADRYLLKGRTEAGANIFIMGSPVEVNDSGDFETLLMFKRGANVLVVEAVDQLGNTTYKSQVVNAKF